MLRWAAIIVCAWAVSAEGQPLGVFGGRAPAHGDGAVGRAPLSLPRGDAGWAAAEVAGVHPQAGPLAIPASDPGSPLQLGVHTKPAGGPIGIRHAGTMQVESGELVWRARISSPRAEALRLHITGLDLGADSYLLVAGAEDEAYVLEGRGALGAGSEWTPVLRGGAAYLEWHGPVTGGTPRFEVSEIAEIAFPRQLTHHDLLPCQVDVQCGSVDATARDAVGWMVYSTPQGTFACTGALLNDTDPLTTLGWFLTSNRCINTASAAASVTVYWFYQTPSCNGTPPNTATLPVSQGATLVYNSTAADGSLLLLAQNPANGQGLAGWTGQEPAGTLTTIHHPLGAHKHLAVGSPTLQGPVCSGTPGYYQFHYLKYTQGITENGSPGAPLFNSGWQIVGQLYGFCSVQGPACDNPQDWNATFGKFSRTLPSIRGVLTGQFSPARVYVNGAATGTGTGLTWEDAYTDLGAALAQATPPVGGMEIWVAAGTYRPGPANGDQESAFALVPGVRVYGGFAGTETLLSQRNIAANLTILSGDLNANDGAGFSNRGDNVYHVVRATGVDSTAVLDGFTIRGGYAYGPASYNDKGGGLYAEAGAPHIANCSFEANAGNFGGGGCTFYYGSAADVTSCRFEGNASRFGGGIGLTGAGGTISDCVFVSNVTQNDGAGIDAYESSITVNSCQFMNNNAGSRGGAISGFQTPNVVMNSCLMKDNYAGYGGGAVHGWATHLDFTNCTVVGNEAQFFGGGVLHQVNATTTARECRFLGNSGTREGAGIHANSGTLDLVNCEIVGNSTPDFGGGVWHNKGCISTIVNCTVARNSSGALAGGVGFEDGVANLVNCILWQNTDSSGGGQAAQVGTFNSTTAVNYSIVQALTGSLGTGNSAADPLFVNVLGTDGLPGTEDDDLALAPGSPARDSGDNTPVQAILTDLRGNARRREDLCVANTGVGTAPIVDRGAIEGAPCVCYTNCDESTGTPLLTQNDFQCFINRFAAGETYANCDGSTGVPLLTQNDFQCFLNRFATGCS